MSRRRPFARTAVAVAGAAVLLTACGGGGDSSAGGGTDTGGSSSDSDATGITDTSIKLGTHMPLTGVAAPGYSEISPGTKAYFDYVNDQGGVNGRKIEYTVRDDTYNPTKTTEVVNQLVLDDKVFGILQGLGTPTHSAVIDQLNEDKVPDLFASSGALAWDDPEKYPYTFGWQPDYEIEGKIIGKYIKEKLPNAKVGLYLQGDDLGADGAKGLKQFISDQIVSEVTYTSGGTDVAPQIGKLKADGADLVVGFNTPTYTALSQLTARALNYKPQWFYSNVALDPNLVGTLLASYSKGAVTPEAGIALLNGNYTTKYFATVDQTDDPWVQLWNKVWKAKGNGKPLTNFNVYGMAGAYTFVQALQAAGQDVTRDGLVKALEEKGSSFQGPSFAPFDYSATSHRGISGVKVVQVKNGGISELTPTQVTNDGDAPITVADNPPAAPPANGIPTS